MADNPLELSDEDFLKINPPEVTQTPLPEKEEVSSVEPKVEESKSEDTTVVTEEVTTEDNPDNKEKDKTPPKIEDKSKEEWKEFVPDTTKSDEENATAKAEHDKTKPAEDAATKTNDEKNPDGTPKTKTEAEQVKEPVDYEAVYNKLMTPFKANGKEIKLNNIDEAIRLMQMGAGYGKKLQDLQPHLKTIRMLEKNNILDPNRISFLIDINNKNPDAIKKLVKESGIDPLDLNTDDAVTYTPTNHQVSDSEFNFNTALQDVLSIPGGKETVQEINTKWDKTSKQALWESPELLQVIQSQRENGIYAQITDEIDRQKLLGHIPPNTPFLQAYKTMGDLLVKENRLLPPNNVSTTTPAPKEPVVIETRTAQVKSQVANSEQAKAAAPTQATPRKAATITNPLEMPDDEFMKQFPNGRL